MDDSDRKKIITVSLLFQNGSVFLCAIVMYFIMPYHGKTVPYDNLTFLVLFVLLNLLGASAALASMAESIAVGRDWVVVICGDDKELLTSMYRYILWSDGLC